MSNDFIPFAVGGSANVITQSAYAALTSVTQNGFQAGIAQSNQLNKVWRQSSIMAAVLAQFIVDQSGQNAVDDGTTATLETNLITAIKNATKQTVILADTGAANAYTATNTPALTALPSTGYVQRVNIAHANTGASTYAPDGLTAKPIYGLGLQPLQGGELPVGVVVLMYLVQAGVNSGNGAWIIIESLGGASQVAPATQSQHAVQMAQAAGVVGSVRNLKMYLSAASASATVTADEIIVETALGGVRYCLPSFSKTINLATTGAGGMDTGAAPVSGFVAIYAIYNPTTQTAALLATNASSLVANVYGGANMPSGYTASGLLAVVPTNASSQFKPVLVRDRKHGIVSTQVLNTSTASSNTTLSLSATIPANAICIGGELSLVSTASSAMSLNVTPDSNNLGQQNITLTPGTTLVGNFAMPIVTQQQIIYTASSSAGTPTFAIYIGSYEI
jgi:hypothetical protein